MYNYYKVEASRSLLMFEFFSEGPNGKIKKKVTFKPIDENPFVYNLGFGDVDVNGEIDDVVISNNGDSQKVLTTVAFTVLRFCEKYPDHWVLAIGTTRSRTRLYRMRITNNLEEIKCSFYIFGLQEEVWMSFEKGHDYEAFLFKKK
jgi:hypothetical protein